MRKIIAAILLILAVWVGVEVNAEGVDGAFGGLFVNGPESVAMIDAPPDRTTAKRTRDAFQRAYEKSEDRVEMLLAQPGSED